MTDLLEITPFAVRVRNPNGTLRFTTDEPMFHVTDNADDQINIEFPNNPATNPYARVRSIPLRSVSPFATHVFGVLQTTGDSYGRYPGGTWFDASGTYLHRMHWWDNNANGQFDRANGIKHCVLYNFRVASGTLFLDEEVRFDDYETNGLQSQLPVSLSNFTIIYKLKIGLFT